MADPRTFTVKQCSTAYAAKSGAAIAASTTAKKNFLNSRNLPGDLATLSSSGSKISNGFRTLTSVSDSIRSGTGTLPQSVGGSSQSGANWVLDTSGVGSNTVQSVSHFYPDLAQKTQTQAGEIFNSVQSGQFTPDVAASYMPSFQNMARLGQNIFTPSSGDVQSGVSERCEASPYAVDLIARAPKYKFLFVVQFIADEGYSELGGGDYGPLDMAFTVKKSTRPSAKFVTEDVNYYNFRTKVITKTEFEEMSMSFHDDTMNIATQFYTAYLRAMSPITGIVPGAQTHSDLLEERGMDFMDNTLRSNEIINAIDGNTYAATHGPLASDSKQVFKEIRLYHLFDYGNRMTVYRFVNPRILSLSPDEVDMSVGNEGNELTITFAYDSVYVDADVDLQTTTEYNLAQTQRGGVYQLSYNGTKGSTNNRFNPTATAKSFQYTGSDLLNTTDTGEAVTDSFTQDSNVSFNDRGDPSFDDSGSSTFVDSGSTVPWTA